MKTKTVDAVPRKSKLRYTEDSAGRQNALRKLLTETAEHVHFLDDTLIPDMERDNPESAHLADAKTASRLLKELARGYLASEVPR